MTAAQVKKSSIAHVIMSEIETLVDLEKSPENGEIHSIKVPKILSYVSHLIIKKAKTLFTSQHNFDAPLGVLESPSMALCTGLPFSRQINLKH